MADTGASTGHYVREVDAETRQRHRDLFGNYANGIATVEPGGWVLLPEVRLFLQQLLDFKVESSDVLVVTFPKCGTTWMQEIVWTMRNNPNFDNPLSSMAVNMRVPFIDTDFFMVTGVLDPISPDHSAVRLFHERCPKGSDPKKGFFIQLADHTPRPRTLKTHLPISLLPKGAMETCKVIYVCRNPKDALGSYLHHSRLMKGHDFKGTTEDFVDIFIKDEVVYGPYFSHIKEGWAARDLPNVLFVRYEDLLKDTMTQMRRINAFLGTNFEEDKLEKIAKFTSFSEMKKRCFIFGDSKEEEKMLMNDETIKKDGGFFRKGKSGSWKEELTPEQLARIESWIAKNIEDTDFDFDLCA